MIAWYVPSTPPAAYVARISRANETTRALTGRSSDQSARLRSRSDNTNISGAPTMTAAVARRR